MKAAQGEGRPLLGESLVSLLFKPGWRPEAGARRLAPGGWRTQDRQHCPGNSRPASHRMTVIGFYCGDEGRLVEPAAQ